MMSKANRVGSAALSLDDLYSLRDRVAIVTGGGSGMGLAAVQRLDQAGAHVVVVDIDGSAAQAAAKVVTEGRAIAVQADVSSEDDTIGYVRDAISAFGKIDCFFSNAGILGPSGKLLDSTLDGWNTIMSVNLVGTYLGLREVGRQMSGQDDGGSIVVTASVAGLRSSPGVPIYAASKAAVLSLVRTAAKELGPVGIRVNAICPAPTVTNFSPGMGENPQILEQMRSRIPLGRVAEADDMARVALWLLSDSAAYVNGAFFPVDGGQEA